MNWISVKERLPDHANPVLCYGKGKNGNPYSFAWWNGCWQSFISKQVQTRGITHWCELEAPVPVSELESLNDHVA